MTRVLFQKKMAYYLDKQLLFPMGRFLKAINKQNLLDSRQGYYKLN